MYSDTALMGRDAEHWRWLERLFQVGWGGFGLVWFSLICKSHWTNQFCCILKPGRRIPHFLCVLFCSPHIILCWKLLHRYYKYFKIYFSFSIFNFLHRSMNCCSLYCWVDECANHQNLVDLSDLFNCFYTLQKYSL